MTVVDYVRLRGQAMTLFQQGRYAEAEVKYRQAREAASSPALQADCDGWAAVCRQKVGA